MSVKKAAIIHGTKGSPGGNWFQWLAHELEARGFEPAVPQFPTPENQSPETWLRRFEESFPAGLNESDLLIGHSLGAVFALRLLERANRPVRATAIIAGFTGPLGLPEYDQLNAEFITAPFDWQAIRRNAGEIICVSGDDDPYVPLEQGALIAAKLSVPQIIIHRGGHLNSESGYDSFPELLREFAALGIFSD